MKKTTRKLHLRSSRSTTATAKSNTAVADTIQLYKLICRQVATNLGMTASFLPKPVVGVNGSGMHTNVSVNGKGGKNLMWGCEGRWRSLGDFGWKFIDRILTVGRDT